MYIELIGFLAAILTTAAFVPQAYKIWKTKSAQGVSLTMYLIMFTGVTLWGVYGLFIHSNPMILANFNTASLLIMIIYFKVKHK
ncbi:MAG: SemiSWEET transporter [Flavobacteriaceae bacterium]|nr:SemiSWEET transporter [Flavobacteriaceae bacterium]